MTWFNQSPMKQAMINANSMIKVMEWKQMKVKNPRLELRPMGLNIGETSQAKVTTWIRDWVKNTTQIPRVRRPTQENGSTLGFRWIEVWHHEIPWTQDQEIRVLEVTRWVVKPQGPIRPYPPCSTFPWDPPLKKTFESSQVLHNQVLQYMSTQ